MGKPWCWVPSRFMEQIWFLLISRWTVPISVFPKLDAVFRPITWMFKKIMLVCIVLWLGHYTLQTLSLLKMFGAGLHGKFVKEQSNTKIRTHYYQQLCLLGARFRWTAYGTCIILGRIGYIKSLPAMWAVLITEIVNYSFLITQIFKHSYKFDFLLKFVI